MMNLRAALWMVTAGLLVGTNASRADEGNLYFENIPNNYSLQLEYDPDEYGSWWHIEDDDYLSVNHVVDMGTADVTMLGTSQLQPDLQGLCGYTTLLQSSFINIAGVTMSSYYLAVDAEFVLRSDIVCGVPVHPDGTGVTLYFIGNHSCGAAGAASVTFGDSFMTIEINGTEAGFYENGVLTNYHYPDTSEFDIEVGQTVRIYGADRINVTTASYSTGGATSALANTMTLVVADVE